MAFTFIVATSENAGRTTGSINQVNAHIARHKYAQSGYGRRAVRSDKTGTADGKVVVKVSRRSPRPGSAKVKRRCCQRSKNIKEKYESATKLLRLSSDDAQLGGTVDPFLRLPLDVTKGERGLLHFILTDGRYICGGTSQQSDKCTALNWARSFMQECPVYVRVNLVVAEKVVCHLRGTKPTSRFYLRRSQIYRVINDALADPRTTFYTKVRYMMILGLLEICLSDGDLLRTHALAMRDYIDANGGFPRLIAEKRQVGDTSLTQNLLVPFTGVDLPMSSRVTLEQTTDRFVNCLRRIADWTGRVQVEMELHLANTISDRDCAAGDGVLPSLSKYTDHLVWENLASPETSFTLWAASLRYLLTLCLVQMCSGYNSRQSAKYLREVDFSMSQAVAYDFAEAKLGSKIQPVQATPWLLRDQDENLEQEISFCQDIVDMLAVAPFFSVETRLAVGLDLLQCALISTSWEDVIPFDHRHLELLSEKIMDNWMSTQFVLIAKDEEVRSQGRSSVDSEPITPGDFLKREISGQSSPVI